MRVGSSSTRKIPPPDAQVALDLIRDIYVVEHEVRNAGLTGTDQHAVARWERCLPIMDKLYVWLDAQKHAPPPKSKMGAAVRYSLKNWQALTRYVRDTRVPPDNNRAENALRVVALGRKNFLFVGHEQAGANLAALYTVVATCLAHDLDPLAYLSDVLMRLDSTAADSINTLLPQNLRTGLARRKDPLRRSWLDGYVRAAQQAPP